MLERYLQRSALLVCEAFGVKPCVQSARMCVMREEG
jgi:hypothetical protein